MEITVKPALVDLLYHTNFKDPAFEMFEENKRQSIVKILMESFALRLNDFKFNNDRLSDNFLHFSKFDNSSFFDVNLGFEEATAQLRNARDREQAKKFYYDFAKVIEGIPFTKQRWTVQRQLATNDDAKSYLKSLNPGCPKDFKGFLDTNGVYYTLKFTEYELTIYITLIDSYQVPGGIYLSIESVFSPNQYDFQKAVEILEKQDNFILEGLGIKIEQEI